MINKSASAIKLRLYQKLSNIASEKNVTILFLFPKEVLSRNDKAKLKLKSKKKHKSNNIKNASLIS